MAFLRRGVAAAISLAAGVHGLRLTEDGVNSANASVAVNESRPASRATAVKWTYFPPEPRLGIAFGGSPQEFATGEYGAKNALILLQYAKRKGYALYVDKNMARHSVRNPSWNKLHVLHQLIDDVPMLVWMDADVVMTRPDFSLYTHIKQTKCNGVHQTRWEEYLPKEVQDDTFLWLPASDRPGGADQYEVNTAPGMMVLRRSDEAKEFLEKVWHVGDNPGYFLRHRAAAKPREGQTGEWPYEQGAIWDVLAATPDKYMRKACIPPPGHLVSLDNHHWKETMMLRRVSDKKQSQRNSIVGQYFDSFGLKTML
uniref:Nucleotide-diphospho-sugar transferase domain-containing protein n=1 Tax=Alexandrium catenella TaxID=2925 RepID=A0A7S1RNN8_ALECA